MQPNDKQAFGELLGDVMAYYQKPTTPFLLSTFWDGLRKHEFEDVSRAFSLHACDPDRGQFAPRVADITRMLEGSTQTQGMRAWAKLETAMRSVGAYRSVAFDDPLIHVVVNEMGGWTTLCRCQVDELPFKAREFERRYASYRLRREIPTFAPRLIGESEAENRLNGHTNFEVRPVLLGDPARAALVMERGTGRSALRITDAGKVTGELLARLKDQNREDAA